MGAGQTLSEEVFRKWSDVQSLVSKLQASLSLDTPESVEGLVNTIEPSGPFGAKEVGEGAVAGILGAIANAVHDAIGVRIKELPITPEKILRALGKI